MFSGVPGDTFLTLWLKTTSGNNVTLWHGADSMGMELIAREGTEKASTADVYFSTCPAVSVPTDRPSSKRITQKSVACIPMLFIDCDTLEDSSKAGKALPNDKRGAVQVLQALTVPPSVLVDSGHGIHAYWLLDKPLQPEEGKKTLKAFARSIAQVTGWAGLDIGASEPARVLRLPGTLNHKEEPPLEVRMLEEGTGGIYTIADIEAFIAAVGNEQRNTSSGNDGEVADAFELFDLVHAPGKLSDAEVIAKASAAADGSKFMALMNGDTSGYASDDSAADGALCCLLAFWTGKDAAQMDRIFRTSGLMREKWDRKTGSGTYGSITIDTAIKKTRNTYTPGGPADTHADSPALAPFYAAFEKVPGYGMHRGRVIRKKENAKGEIEFITLAGFSALIRKTISRDDGVSVSKEYLIDGRDCWGAALEAVRVKLSDFNKMEWAGNAWGNDAIISPGNGTKDHLRYAIQEASNHAQPPMQKETIYAHIGWTERSGRPAYLYHGGAVGAHRVSVELEGALTGYKLPDTVKDAKTAIMASLKMLEIAPAPVAMPIFAHTYLAPLCHFLRMAGIPPAFTLYLAGGTGTRKSTIAAIEMAHYGAEWSGKRMPANFNDTANALMQKAFLCKDAPLLVDDFRPSSSMKERREMDAKAQRLATGWGDYAARARLRSDSTMEAERPPRGIGLITGEDAPNITESGTARFFVVQVGQTDIPISAALKQVQSSGSNGLLAEAMRTYIEWIARQNPAELVASLKDAFEKYREEAAGMISGAHGRSAEAVAFLWLGLRCALNCFLHYDAINEDELLHHWETGKQAITSNAMTQRDGAKDEKPTLMYLQAIHELVSSGNERLDNIAIQGFTGKILGYFDNEYLYLIPGIAYAAVQEHFRQQGSAFPLTRLTIQKRLFEEGYLTRRDEADGYLMGKRVPYKGKTERFVTLKRGRLAAINCDPAAGLPVVDIAAAATERGLYDE